MDFDAYFEATFGSRWSQSLKPSLLAPPMKTHMRFSESGLMLDREPRSDAYALDRASLEPVFALELKDGMHFLDICSAPGGKALAALFICPDLRARLNDVSRERVQRLKAVLHDYLPEEKVRRLSITCSDGARIGQREPNTYDRVLADVPCSAERHHLLGGEKQFQWTERASKRLAVRQHALLCSAIDAACPGGRVVYSTCSISPVENDGVIEKLHKSRKGEFQVLQTAAKMGEPTRFGHLILPDRHEGSGPIYYCVLQKLLIEK